MSEESVKKPRPKLRDLDQVTHPIFGKCLVMGNEADGLVNLKDDDGEWQRDVDADELSFHVLPFIQDVFAKGNWYKSCRYFNLLGNAKSIRLLEFLFNWNLTAGKKAEWFYCMDDLLIRKAYITSKSAQASIRFLRDKGYIQTEIRTTRTGRGSERSKKRYIRIDCDHIYKILVREKQKWEKRFPNHIEWSPDED